jgi:hypothetical protein
MDWMIRFIGASLQLHPIITAHNQWLPKTRSIPYWTTSVFCSTVTWLSSVLGIGHFFSFRCPLVNTPQLNTQLSDESRMPNYSSLSNELSWWTEYVTVLHFLCYSVFLCLSVTAGTRLPSNSHILHNTKINFRLWIAIVKQKVK